VAFDDHAALSSTAESCQDVAAAIDTVVRAKRWCSAVDLAATRAGAAE
jgi:hypothetical protein